jgi:dTDP-4-amino-4,6-dideoxygalactose transaminase
MAANLREELKAKKQAYVQDEIIAAAARLFAERGIAGVVRLPAQTPGCYHIFNQYVVRVPNRNFVKRHLESRGIGTAIYYPVPFHMQECFRYLGYRQGQFPRAERAAEETLALPIYGELTEDQQRYVVGAVAEAVERTP